MSTTPTEHGARWRASLLAKAIEIAGTASGTPDNRTLVAMFDDELEAFAGYVLDASGRVDAGYRQGWEEVRDALGLRGNLPVSNAQYHASVLMPKLREVIRAATPVPVESLGRVPRAEHSPPRAVPNMSKSWPDRDYMCVCSQCGDTFIGWKRQAVCRGCASPESAPSAPADWNVDSSLETWFPYTAERLKALEAENEKLKAQQASAPALADVEEIALAVESIPVPPSKQFECGWRDDEIWRWALRSAAAMIRLSSAPAAVKDCLTTADVEALDSVENIQAFARAYRAEVPNAELTVHGIAYGLGAVARRLSGAQQAAKDGA